MKTFFIALAGMVIGSSASYSFDGSGSIVSGGQNRSFLLHAPGSSVSPGLPLVIIMHGDGGDAAGIKSYAGFDGASEGGNFIAVYPNALAGSWNRYADDQPGDAGLGNPNAPDDVQFISDLVDYFCSTYQIDASRVYATGHSAGGFMAYNLGVQLTSKIAAIAPVAGSLWGAQSYLNNYFINDFVPIPIYHVHGDNDGTVSYPDPNHTPVAWEEWPLSGFSSPSCGNTTYTGVTDIIPNSVKKLSFCDGSDPNGKEVLLIRIIGHGHGWPNAGGYSTAGAIWTFFAQYQLGGTIACGTTGIAEENPLQKLVLAPVPTGETLNLLHLEESFSAVITDISGKTAMSVSSTSMHSLNVAALAPGTYFITVSTASGTRSMPFIRQ